MVFHRCLCHGYVENYAGMWTIWRMMCEDPVHYHGHSHSLVDAVKRSGRSQASGILKTLTCFSSLSSFNFQRNVVGCQTEDGETCVFPFIYRGEVYSKCTSVNADKPWCFTGTSTRNWDYCLLQVKLK